MKCLVSLLFLSALAFISHAQTSAPISEYFDKDWKTVTNPAEAAYYRTIEQNDAGFLVRDYFISGKIRMMATCSEAGIKPHFEGKRVVYYENGNVEEEGQYHLNREVGVHKSYYENGKPKMEVSYEGKDTRYLHYWSETGEDELADGEAVIKHFSNDKVDNYRSIRNFVMSNAFSIERSTGDTLFTVVEKMPMYTGGLAQLSQDVKRNLVYPKSARKRGIEGTVYVGFVVNKEGAVTDLKVIRGIDPECDEAALAAVSKLGKWQPGTQKNDSPDAVEKPVNCRFVVPINFKR